MTPIHVVGIGLTGWDDLTQAVRDIVERATLLVGSPRHLSYFDGHPAPRVVLRDLSEGLAILQERLTARSHERVVILASGDPLFFGLGRLLLTVFPPGQVFFPSPSQFGAIGL